MRQTILAGEQAASAVAHAVTCSVAERATLGVDLQLELNAVAAIN